MIVVLRSTRKIQTKSKNLNLPDVRAALTGKDAKVQHAPERKDI